ncbi:MAG: hypothetical protein M3461_05275 [Pseudomonadota bacterium]|nr:hypothetical protein [Pseudomonadota bacterium]
MNTDTRHNRTVLDALIPQLAPLQDLPPPRLQRLIDESSVLDYAPGRDITCSDRATATPTCSIC